MSDETATSSQSSSSATAGATSQGADNQSVSTSQASQGGATTQQTTSQQQAPTRPEYVPEKFWDATAGKISDDKALASHFNEITARVAAEESRRLALPQSPDAYKIELPADFKAPDGVEFKFNDADPLLAQAKSLYHDIQTGKLSGQEGFSKLLSLHAGAQVASAQAVQNAKNAEIAKLGATGPARVDAVTTFLTSYLGEAEGKQLASRMFTASDVAIVEKLVAKITNQGGASFSTRGREAPTPAGRLSPEQVAKLSPADKLDYNRKFDQSQMPAWKDPRAA